MKKSVVLTIRVDDETSDAIRSLALADDRSVAWIARTLLIEALTTRKRLKSQANKKH